MQFSKVAALVSLIIAALNICCESYNHHHTVLPATRILSTHQKRPIKNFLRIRPSNIITEKFQALADYGTISENGGNGFWNSTKIVIRKVTPYLIFFSALLILFQSPIIANAVDKVKKSVKSGGATVTTVKKTSKAGSKILFVLKKLMDGANVKGSTKNWKVGDTRSDYATLINSVSSSLLLASLALLAYFLHKKEEFTRDRKMIKETGKVKIYKENMYFEAVETILKKLADPKLKGSAKANLTKQLQELDPDEKIRKYLEEGGDRPDISDRVDIAPKKKNPDSSPALKKKKPSRPADSNNSNKNIDKKKVTTYDDDDEDELNVDDEEDDLNDDDDVRRAPPKGTQKKRSGVSGGSNSNNKGKNSNNDNKSDSSSIKKVLDALDDSLDGLVTDSNKKKLIAHLQNRITSISDKTKQTAAITKIAEKLGDDDYWINYIENKL
eukprot:gene5017-7004_t